MSVFQVVMAVFVGVIGGLGFCLLLHYLDYRPARARRLPVTPEAE